MIEIRETLFSATKKDFKVVTFCTGGPGGQNQNRKKNGVRITHIESGLSSECRELKSQGENKKRAFRKLCDLLVKRYVKTKGYATSKETIRTYHQPDNRVKDHESGLVQSYSEVVDAGEIAEMVTARTQALVAQRE